MVGLIEENDVLEFPKNSRIKVYEEIGTIKYVGEVSNLLNVYIKIHNSMFLILLQIKGYQGMWIGVEWDDPDRGKHNGSVNGIHYFKTK